MDAFKPKGNPKTGPELKLQEKVVAKLRNLEWFVKKSHGNVYSFGWPDLFCAHAKYGSRWIELKVEGAFSFTPAQLEVFPQFSAKNVAIYVVTHEDQVPDLLFKPGNWYLYLQIFNKIRHKNI